MDMPKLEAGATFGRKQRAAFHDRSDQAAYVLAFHKRCNTIERNTTKMVATIKSVTCPLALCKKPGRLF